MKKVVNLGVIEYVGWASQAQRQPAFDLIKSVLFVYLITLSYYQYTRPVKG